MRIQYCVLLSLILAFLLSCGCLVVSERNTKKFDPNIVGYTKTKVHEDWGKPELSGSIHEGSTEKEFEVSWKPALHPEFSLVDRGYWIVQYNRGYVESAAHDWSHIPAKDKEAIDIRLNEERERRLRENLNR